MPSIRAKDSTYPILTNERSSSRMIGQAIAVPFLLFLFHTINRHLWFIDIGARGSTPTPQPFLYGVSGPRERIPRYNKESKKGSKPLKQKALKTDMTWQRWSPSSTRFKAGIFLLFLVGTEHPILLILLSHRLELSLSGWIRKKFTRKIDMTQSLKSMMCPALLLLIPTHLP